MKFVDLSEFTVDKLKLFILFLDEDFKSKPVLKVDIVKFIVSDMEKVRAH